jgi:hypothetical protein
VSRFLLEKSIQFAKIRKVLFCQNKKINKHIWQIINIWNLKIKDVKKEMFQVDICDSCAKDKRIVFVGKVKIYDRPVRTASLCQDCFSQECFCSICSKRTSYSSYEKHLLKSHSSNQMALQLVNAKILSDLM